MMTTPVDGAVPGIKRALPIQVPGVEPGVFKHVVTIFEKSFCCFGAGMSVERKHEDFCVPEVETGITGAMQSLGTEADKVVIGTTGRSTWDPTLSMELTGTSRQPVILPFFMAKGLKSFSRRLVTGKAVDDAVNSRFLPCVGNRDDGMSVLVRAHGFGW